MGKLKGGLMWSRRQVGAMVVTEGRAGIDDVLDADQVV